jgi:hypothetical protein
MNLSVALRHAVTDQTKKYARAESIPHCLSYGDSPAVCFFPYESDLRHGNFLDRSYKAIQANPEWRKRLMKVHTLGKRSLPATERGSWMELDTCISSDALLMNIFCHPAVLRNSRVLALLDIDFKTTPIFGYKARVPLANSRFDRTEVDMRIGNLLIEAKLTETDFQSAEKKTLLTYLDFSDVFDCRQLPQTRDRYLSYQLLRNVLAAYALQCSFCVLIDARRTDLADAWYEVVKCVKPVDLRTRLRISTWQEITQHTPAILRRFLSAKYGLGESIGTSD